MDPRTGKRIQAGRLFDPASGPYVHGRAIVEGRYAMMAGAVGAAALALQERRQVSQR